MLNAKVSNDEILFLKILKYYNITTFCTKLCYAFKQMMQWIKDLNDFNKTRQRQMF